MTDIEINDYDYDLPPERIAQYPVAERDSSSLLISYKNKISKDIFRNITDYLPSGSLLVFNNTKVIRARLLFQKESGASIEILCLEPLSPHIYEIALSSREPVEWKCIIGNLKKWKKGIISTNFKHSGQDVVLKAERLTDEGEAWNVRFSWDKPSLTFGEVIEATGHIPLPPYIQREDETEDITRYQTVYSKVKGSVAAPTAGLHFTKNVLANLSEKDIKKAEITLHVGAGTFKPVKSDIISEHEMHSEHFFVTYDTIQLLLANIGKIIAVGTTSVRTLESLYWLGVKLKTNPTVLLEELSLKQWEAYNFKKDISVQESLEILLNYLKKSGQSVLKASTSIIIIPGYKFRMISGMITNFHQPRSTLLLLVSAWSGEKWKEIYKFALDNGFRFLSYGDCSLLLDNN